MISNQDLISSLSNSVLDNLIVSSNEITFNTETGEYLISLESINPYKGFLFTTSKMLKTMPDDIKHMFEANMSAHSDITPKTINGIYGLYSEFKGLSRNELLIYIKEHIEGKN